MAPLSFAQRRVWFAGGLCGRSPEFNIVMSWRVIGSLDRGVLRDAVTGIVARHQILGCRVATVAGEPLLVKCGEEFSWVPGDVSAEADPAAAAAEIVRHEGLQAFDVAMEPLLKVCVLRLGAAEFVVSFVVHHLVFDRWSMAVFLRELSELYAAGARGRAPALEELPTQYTAFVEWERASLAAPGLTASLGYWREQLSGLERVELPTDFTRGASPSWEGGFVQFVITGEVARGLRELATRDDTTLFMVALAVFQVLIGRFAATADVAIGTPVSGREMVEAEGLVGLFLNPLVLRADLSGDPTFEEFLRRVRAIMLAAHAHRAVPYERLVRHLRPDQALGRMPLFDVWFEMDTSEPAELDLPGLRTSVFEVPRNVVMFDLALSLRERVDCLEAVLGYRGDLLTEQTARRIAAGFLELAADVAVDASRRISTLAVMPEREYRATVVEYNDTAATIRPGLVHEWIEEAALNSPEATAVISGPNRWTFGEVDRRASQLAWYLRDLGVGTESPVGVCLDRGLDLVVALLAVLKSGGCYVPLDPGFPPARAQLMLVDVGCQVLVTKHRLAADLAGFPGKVLLVDRDRPVISRYASTGPASATRPDSLAYIIYTSGSTGRPKGVMIEHAALANFVDWCARGYASRDGSGAPVFSSVAFDAVVPNLYTPLTLGQPVHLLPPDLDTESLGPLLAQAAPYSFIKLTPSHLDLLSHQLTTSQARALAGTIVVGADAFPASTLRRWRELAGDITVLNEYGPTEATVANSTYDAANQPLTPLVPIGKPIPNTTMYVLNDSLRPAPPGVIGELYIGGACVARGYHGQPGLTARTFIPDPYSQRPGARLYRTGDHGRMLADGNIEFTGRRDDQLKIRGYRIEPSEVEAALTSHPAISNAFVTATQGPVGPRLAAYVVPAVSGDPPATSDLRVQLSLTLPQHMIPTTIITVPALPLTPHGKVDRNALPPPDTAARSEDDQITKLTTPAQEAIAAAWEEVLGVTGVRANDNFFDLGGDSIVSIQVIARLAMRGFKVTPRMIFQYQDVAALAAHATPVPAAADQSSVAGEVPLTPIQRWFFTAGMGQPNGYSQSMLLDLLYADPAALRVALAALLTHHDALRTRFTIGDDGWRQHVADPEPAPEDLLQEFDLTEVPESEQPARLSQLVAEVQQGIDISAGPMMRAALFSLGQPRGSLLMITIHHLVVDGVSWRIILEDLADACRQSHQGHEPVLPAKTTSFQRWAGDLVRYANSGELKAEVDYWRQVVRSGKLPRDFRTGSNTAASAATVGMTLTVAETDTLFTHTARALGARINDLLLSAFACSVRDWTSSTKVSLDLEGHGREDAVGDLDVSRTVGWFTSVYPVTLDIPADMDMRGTVRAVGEQLARIPGKGIGYGVLRYISDPGIQEQLDRGPTGEICFNYLGRFNPEVTGLGRHAELPDTTVSALRPHDQRAYLLTIDCLVEHGKLVATLTYSSDLHSAATMRSLTEGFANYLRGLIEAAN
jgi:amino acid adenylation domain-containing protein/non-ribosomal peptide synthase protein (TIGR01720 family)